MNRAIVVALAAVVLAGCGDPIDDGRRPEVDRAPTIGEPPRACAGVFSDGADVDGLDFDKTCTDPTGALIYPGATYVDCPDGRALRNEYGWGPIGGRWHTEGQPCP